MCVLALAWDAHPHWRLVVAGNRDERHARPAKALQRWENNTDVLAGQDLLSGGTWLGVSEQGRFAVVTNLRGYGPPKIDAPSRGLLLSDLLMGAGRYAHLPRGDLSRFSAFNLLTLVEGQLTFSTNEPEATQRVLGPGVYGLSNAALDEPWPKTVRLKNILTDWLAEDSRAPDRLVGGLSEDAVLVADDPGSAIFIRDPTYGTRCSSVVGIDRDGQGVFIERRFDPEGRISGETTLAFAWPAGA